MRTALRIVFLLVAMFGPARAEVAPVAVRAPQPTAWTGQKLPLFVDLRSRGSFDGSASFSIPQIPGTVLMKVGNPVVSSTELEGESWFVQSHEFALFSQRSGSLKIPSFAVRFGSRDGFTGPVKEIEASVPAVDVEILRPPGTEEIGFLITTDSLDISETWEPQPAAAEVGAIFKRTIVQRANQMTGMALAPAPAGNLDGIKIYPPKAETNDKTERGEFSGERREAVTYLIEKSGSVTLPEIRYVWWNPKTETIETKVLSSLTIQVAALPTVDSIVGKRASWPWWLGSVLALSGLYWQRNRIISLCSECWRKCNPPHRSAARRVLRACTQNDAPAANAAWSRWTQLRPTGTKTTPACDRELKVLRRQLFATGKAEPWNGQALAREFRSCLRLSQQNLKRKSRSALPSLN